jgi:hypothetical protein
MDYRFLPQSGSLSAAAEQDAPEPRREASPSGVTPPARRTRRAPPPANLTRLTVSPEVLALVPASIAIENLLLPLAFDGETLTLASADPDNIALADRIRFLLAKNVRLVPAAREELARAIRRHYGEQAGASADSMLQECTDTALDFTESDLALAGPVAGTSVQRPSATPRPAGHWSRQAGPLFRVRAPAAVPPTNSARGHGMWFYTVDEGQRVLMTRLGGKKEILIGPARVWSWLRRFEPMQHHVAHPGEFLIVRYRAGHQQHLPGPAEVWLDPREHESITREDCVQIAAKEAVVVYSRSGPSETTPSDISRRVVHGPALFVPQPGEWLHTFSWHASKGGHQGVEKTPNALVFQKLWLMPDQMYHDVRDVRTADNAVLTIRLMVFFELVDIERMLDATHDPVGDFVNAATADVVAFAGRHDFESFKQNTDKLNDLATYKTLTSRAQQIGYKIANVVYRGYGAAESLQKMHDQAIEARTRLQLERATEEQTQQLEDYKLESQMARAAKRRAEQSEEVRHELGLASERQAAELANQQARQEFLRQQQEAQAALDLDIRRQLDGRQREHLAALREFGVDLTAYLTQARADRVIELRGSVAPHLHLDAQGFKEMNKGVE